MGALGAHNAEVKRLRALLRDADVRAEQQACVLDGPRAISGALDRGAVIGAMYLGVDAQAEARLVARRARERGIAVTELAAGGATRIAAVHASAGVLALVHTRRPELESIDHGDFWLLAAQINDPGNLGTLIRAAEAAGASGIIVGERSVDVYNPKVVRASAGAVFGIPVVEANAMDMSKRLGARGLLRLGAVARGGTPLDRAPLVGPVALIVGHETRGIADVPVDGVVSIPMIGSADSLNVAIAGSVLLFETARQRRTAGANP